MQKNGFAVEILSVPQRAFEAVRFHIPGQPAPFVFAPAFVEIARQQLEVGLVIMRLGIVRVDGQRAIKGRESVIEPAEFRKAQAHIIVRIDIIRSEGKRVFAASHGLLKPVLFQEYGRQAGAGFGVVRSDGQDMPVAGHGLVKLALVKEQGGLCRRVGGIDLLIKYRAEVVVRPGMARPDRQRAPETGGGVIEPALLEEYIAQIKMGFGIVRADGARALAARGGLGEFALREEYAGQIIMGHDVAGSEGDGAAEYCRGIIEPAPFAQCVTEVVAGLGKIRVEGEGALKTRRRLAGFFLPAERQAEIVVKGGHIPLEPDRLADQIHGGIVTPAVEVYDSQVMQTAGMTGIDRQNLSIKRLGLRQPPGLVMLQGIVEKILNDRRIHRGITFQKGTLSAGRRAGKG